MGETCIRDATKRETERHEDLPLPVLKERISQELEKISLYLSGPEKETPSAELYVSLRFLFAAVPFQKDYEQKMVENGERLARALKGDFWTSLVKNSWLFVPQVFKQKYLRHVGALFDRAFDYEGFSFFSKTPFHFSPGKYEVGNLGCYDNIGDRLMVNLDPKAPPRLLFSFAMNVLVHEKTHQHQWYLVQLKKAMALKRHAHWQEQAEIFTDFFAEKGKPKRLYLRAHCDPETHQLHPLERQASQIAQIVTERVGYGRYEKPFCCVARSLCRAKESVRSFFTARRSPGAVLQP